jgi:ParB-like chromosome segregation protein Spo0J
MNVLEELCNEVRKINDIDEKICLINKIKKSLHEVSPFKDEPVDCVIWEKQDNIHANDYNPNSVAPPEMELLYTSIKNDGYTQPIVSWHDSKSYEVVDGFHRHRVGREKSDVNERIHGYLPLVVINDKTSGKSDRMASTIRHNRARGKHSINSMSDIVIELKKRNWTDSRISKNLGMEPDEVLRLCQINGLSDAFKDREFSQGWEYEPVDNESEVDLEKAWPSNIQEIGRDEGWTFPSDTYGYLIGKKSQRLGSIQKSRFGAGWFVYAYTQPMVESKESTKKDAMKFIETASK